MCLSVEYVLSDRRHIKPSENIQCEHSIFTLSSPVNKRWHRGVCTACKLIPGTSFSIRRPCLREDSTCLSVYLHLCIMGTCEPGCEYTRPHLVMPHPLFSEKGLGRLKTPHQWFLLRFFFLCLFSLSYCSSSLYGLNVP